MESTIAPDKILDSKDRGDETQQRFRYQNSCACFISINMLSDGCPFNEVFCELHEDLLLKSHSGKFTGVQVKTRNADYGAFNLKDEAIIKTITRFVELDKKFPEYFERYIIASNVGFDNNASVDIRALVRDAKSGKIDLSNRTYIASFIKNISKNIEVSTAEVISTVKKIQLRPSMPQFTDIEDKIISTLGKHQEYRNTLHRVITEVVDDFILLHYNASSLAFDELAYNGYIFDENPSDAEVGIVIESKKITKDKLLDIVQKNISRQNLIKPRKQRSVLEFTPSTKILERKLDAGNVNIENIDILKDDKYAFETLMTERFYKDESQANEEYNHYRTMMLSECQDSYDRFDKNTVFGMQMLIDVKDRIKDRMKYDKEHLYECTPEHLLGMVAILTEECKVWWSDKFEI